MKILITGGSGVVGQGAIEALLRRGHQVRLLSRHASQESKLWPDTVELFEGDVGDRTSLGGAADGCEIVLHVAGIVSEKPPDETFQRINVEGTRNVLDEATRAKVHRFIYVSSLGADRGSSDYHKSKRAAEQLVRGWTGPWLILRPANVYGPGDEVMSLLMKMVRVLPALPVIDRGRQRFQPIWHLDLGEAIARCVDDTSMQNRVLELAGPETTSMNELIERMAQLDGRNVLQLSIPNIVARVSVTVASSLGFDAFDTNKLTMLEEELVLHGANALYELGIRPTPLEEGLRLLRESLPEKLPSDGIGPVRQKRFRTDIAAPVYNRHELFELFRNRFATLMPFDVSDQPLNEGTTLSLHLPLRGEVQVRVEKVTSQTIILATLEGHPLAGMVRFDFKNHDGMIRFEIRVIDRSAGLVDFFTMETIGNVVQDRAWWLLAENVIRESGGRSDHGIEMDDHPLDEAEQLEAEQWAAEIVAARVRKEREGLSR